MSMARIDAGALLALGMDRQTVEALRHMIRQVGNQVGAETLPSVAQQAAIVPAIEQRTAFLSLRSSLAADKIAGNTAADVEVLSLVVNKKLTEGAMFAGRVIGTTTNGSTPGTLNLWLSIDGAKVLTHSFTTPDVPGAGKGFAADFLVNVRPDGVGHAGGVLQLAYNAPTVLPAVAAVAFPLPAGAGSVWRLGMNWTAADPGNSATVNVAHLSAEKI